jgi:outer membrane protein assembly factor BamB
MLLVGAAAASVLLLAGGGALGYVLYVRYEGRDIRGSSTEEFIPVEPISTQPPPMPAPPTPRSRKAAKARKIPVVAGIEWPFFGFDERRLHDRPSSQRPPFRKLWLFRGRQLLEFPPAVAYDKLYVANNSGVLFAVHAKTGKLAWKHESGRCVAASPAVAKGVVYEAYLNRPPCNSSRTDLDGLVAAFDAKTGKILWQVRIGPTESSPLVAHSLVYVGDWRGKIYALDAHTGRIRWSYQTGGEIKGAVALAGERLYVGSYDGHVYSLWARTGRLIWRASGQDRLGGSGNFYSTPAIAYGRVYIGSTDGKVYSFGAASGTLRWSQSTGGYVYASPAVRRQRIFVGSYSGRFYSLDAATGDVLWEFAANGPISGSATVLGPLVYFATLEERTYALDARTGKLVWSFPDGKYSPLVADTERVYLVGYARVYGMAPRR